jgi:hypothetical protein
MSWNLPLWDGLGPGQLAGSLLMRLVLVCDPGRALALAQSGMNSDLKAQVGLALCLSPDLPSQCGQCGWVPAEAFRCQGHRLTPRSRQRAPALVNWRQSLTGPHGTTDLSSQSPETMGQWQSREPAALSRKEGGEGARTHQMSLREQNNARFCLAQMGSNIKVSRHATLWTRRGERTRIDRPSPGTPCRASNL